MLRQMCWIQELFLLDGPGDALEMISSPGKVVLPDPASADPPKQAVTLGLPTSVQINYYFD
jgi:hypothetical protein